LGRVPLCRAKTNLDPDFYVADHTIRLMKLHDGDTELIIHSKIVQLGVLPPADTTIECHNKSLYGIAFTIIFTMTTIT